MHIHICIDMILITLFSQLLTGDFYQGTLWYSKFKYEPMIKFGNRLNYTAMGIGNHDFDDGADGLVPFAENTTVRREAWAM